MLMVIRHIRVVTWHKKFPTIIFLTPQKGGHLRSRDKLKNFENLFFPYHKTFAQQTWQGSSLWEKV